MTSQRFTLTYAHCTDTGLVRSHNEDSVIVDVDLGLVMVADGMGGHQAGEVASRMATELISASIASATTHDPTTLDRATQRQQVIHKAIHIANERILAAGKSTAAYEGMGTTLVLALFHKDQATIVHIGDSRAYRLRKGKLEQLTQDHSLVQQQLQSDLLTKDQTKEANNRHWLTRALGVMPEVAADMREEKLQAGDRYLLCSDGLSDYLPPLVMASILMQPGSTQTALCQQLIEAANRMGGQDNISVIVVEANQVHTPAMCMPFKWLQHFLVLCVERTKKITKGACAPLLIKFVKL